MRTLDVFAAVMLVLGGMHLGVIGLFGLNPVVGILGGETAALTRLLYVAVGSAGLYQVVNLRRIQRRWGVEIGPA
ncbi:MAG: DUF378 domain-containing protein [Candidatus Binatia bacterium]